MTSPPDRPSRRSIFRRGDIAEWLAAPPPRLLDPEPLCALCREIGQHRSDDIVAHYADGRKLCVVCYQVVDCLPEEVDDE